MATDEAEDVDPEEETPESEEGDASAGDELIEDDLACVRCGYNLRGLKESGRCPECGARVARTLRLLSEDVLCTVCLRPNHALAALCRHCGSPITGAASMASYYKPVATSIPHKESPVAEDEEPDAPRAGFMVASWIVWGSAVLALVIIFLVI